MVWSMSGEAEKNAPSGVDESRAEAGKAKKSYRKSIVFGISAVAVVALIIMAVLVGVYMFTDTFNKILTQTLKTKADTTQEVNVDVTSNIIEYDVKGKDVDGVYVEDYNTYLRVVKFTTNAKSVCYATLLNHTDKADLSSVHETTKMNETDDKVSFEILGGPIPDIGFMNKKARTMCQGVSTYWVRRRCDAPPEAIQKRAICYNLWYICDYYYYWGGYYYCYWEYYYYWC